MEDLAFRFSVCVITYREKQKNYQLCTKKNVTQIKKNSEEDFCYSKFDQVVNVNYSLHKKSKKKITKIFERLCKSYLLPHAHRR